MGVRVKFNLLNTEKYITCVRHNRSRDTTVRFLAWVNFFLLSKQPTRSLGPAEAPIQWTVGDLYPVNTTGGDLNIPLIYIHYCGLQKAWIYPSTPPCVHRGKQTFYIITHLLAIGRAGDATSCSDTLIFYTPS